VTPAKLAEAVLAAAHAVFAARGLDRACLPESVTMQRPRDPGHGDYASPLALHLARRVGLPPRELATALADRLRGTPGIAAVEIIDPGFVNVRLTAAAAGDLARIVVQQGRGYGESAALALSPMAGGLAEAIGADAARYALARRSNNWPAGPNDFAGPNDSGAVDSGGIDIGGVDTSDIDIDRWTRADDDNPVYFVQYYAARTASVARNAADLGLGRGEAGEFWPELLAGERERELLMTLGDFPDVVDAAAERSEPHRVTRYLEQLVGAYREFYYGCRILPRGDEEITAEHRARLWLNDATRTVIANGLRLLGVAAPVRI
jgi:arginyl-tRNA synthetase